MSQLALFEMEEPAASETEPDWPWGYILRNVPDCQCRAMGCPLPCVADHNYLAGCRNCACRATTLPPEAVELSFPVEFADGCGIWIDMRSHAWPLPFETEVDGERRKVWSPSAEMHGACSETGYRSFIGKGDVDPGPGGWTGWGFALAGEAHREWCCPKPKGKKRA